MKIYQYCNKALTYKPVSKKYLIYIIGILAIAFTAGFTSNMGEKEKPQLSQEEVVLIINKNINSSFQPNQLYDYLKELNVKFPEIVFAQAVLETGNFTSKLYRENHNCFGMKLSSRRPTTTHEQDNGHALYENWRASVLDYAFYQTAYLNDLKTKDEYMAFIESNYSETPGYTDRLKDIVNNIDKHLFKP
jgi:uncharacterized FlgJ-related protein